ncbi:MAG: class I SAM-dependent methyltransferase [Acidobacteriota bacterium]
MIVELGHFFRHAPATLALKRRVSQQELYDTVMARADAAGLAERRDELVAGLAGHVVEVGCGTGAMFARYAPPVARVTAIEPDDTFVARALEAASHARVPVEVVAGTGESIPLADGAADAAVLALVLCSVKSPEEVCREVARVVRPGGEVRLLEHVRSPRAVAGVLMHLANPLWLAANGQGCRMNRNPLPVLERVGLRVDHVEPFQVFSAGLPAFPMRLITAIRPG